jgi:hypothetical protein
VLVMVGGTIPADDIAQLRQLGVAGVFTPGAPTQAIVEFLRTGAGISSASSTSDGAATTAAGLASDPPDPKELS